MRLHKIYGVLLRYLFLFRHSYDRLNDTFYWPTMDLVLWGLTSVYFQSFSHNNNIVIAIISGILFWLIVTRGQFEISLNLLEDLWNNNLINIFVSPISFREWITSLLSLALIKSLLSFVFAAIMAFILYKLKIFMFGFYLIPFMLLLIMTAWTLGFLITGFIFRYGTRIQTLAWSMPILLAPFSAIYYPVSILPPWAQYISYCLPTSYIFEGMREVIYKGTLDPHKLLWSLALNIFYLTLANLYLRSSFKSVLEKGLVNVQ